MNLFACELAGLLDKLVWLYTLVLLAYAVVSWLPELRGRWTDYLAAIVEPVLAPIRAVIPPVGGIDLAFLALILALQFLVRPLILQLALRSCLAF